MAASMCAALAGQKRRNEKLLKDARYLGQRVRSQVLPLQVDIAKDKALSNAQIDALRRAAGRGRSDGDSLSGFARPNRRTRPLRWWFRTHSLTAADAGRNGLRSR